jgi:cyclase
MDETTMRRVRVIPVLLLHQEGLYKTVQFSKPAYIGDPVNAVKIFNEKEVDEILVLDIHASRQGKAPDYAKLEEIAGEAFMPMGYGGGIRSVADIRRTIFSGYEKVVLNTAAAQLPALVREGSALVGAQSIVVCIDYKKNWLGRPRVYSHGGTQDTGKHPLDFAREMEDQGAGEVILQSIARDGTFTGYDLEMIHQVSSAVHIPLVACGGASAIDDFVLAVQAGASAVAAGSVFVYRSAMRGVLLNYPSAEELQNKFYSKVSIAS